MTVGNKVKPMYTKLFFKTSEFQALKASSFSRFDWHFADLEIADW